MFNPLLITVLKNFTTEELERMLSEARKKEAQEREAKRESYEGLREDVVQKLHAKAEGLNHALATFKNEAFADMQALHAILIEYSKRHAGGKGNFTVKSDDDSLKIDYSYQENGAFDERSKEAEAHIIDFVSRKFEDETRELITKLLERKKGQLDIKLVQKLYSMEDKFDDAAWKVGIRLLKESWKPTDTKAYISFYKRDEHNKWQLLTLRRITGKTLLEKTYPTYGFDGEWMRSLGDVEKHFKMLIYGPSGSGKTRFCMKLALYLTKWGKVYYNSMEQGEGKGLQDVMRWANPTESQAQKVSIGDREHFDIMLESLESDKHIRFIFIDSLDYMNLTQAQYKWLIEKYPRKCFVIICWSDNKKPKSQHAKAIEYMVDIKAYCERGFVHAKSRYAVGNPLPFRIFEQKVVAPPMLPSEERQYKRNETKTV